MANKYINTIIRAIGLKKDKYRVWSLPIKEYIIIYKKIVAYLK
jgi:hypothetical protein